MKAVIVSRDGADGGARRLVLGDVAEPQPQPDEMVVEVRAISLNRGEVLNALHGADAGHRPGWDYAGVVLAAPADAGHAPGDRVFGLLPRGAWAERVAASPARVAAIPDGVGFAQAAALPVAGLTAALALAKRDDLAGLAVLVTGATGGVGLLAVQLAARAGARVTALARDRAQADLLRRLGAAAVAHDLADLDAEGPFDMAVEAVGGATLGAVLERLSGRGWCVLVGDAGGSVTTFDAAGFRRFGATTLYGFFLGDELTRRRPAEPLAALARAVAEDGLDPVISTERPWTDIDAVAHDLLDRRMMGKAVLHVSS